MNDRKRNIIPEWTPTRRGVKANFLAVTRPCALPDFQPMKEQMYSQMPDSTVIVKPDFAGTSKLHPVS